MLATLIGLARRCPHEPLHRPNARPFLLLPTLIERFTLADTYGGRDCAEWFAAGVTMLVPTLLIGATFRRRRVPMAAKAQPYRAVVRLFNTLGARWLARCWLASH